MAALKLCAALLLAAASAAEALGRSSPAGAGVGGASIFSVVGYPAEAPAVAPAAGRRRVYYDPGPPPHDQPARMARYIVHNSDWTSMATISTRDPIQGAPFANVFSVSDGADVSQASGVPYLYLTPLEMSVKDLEVNNAASLTMSLAQGRYCDRKRLDPEDPRCAHIILNGQVIQIPTNTTEETFAKKALFSRHPDMEGWPEDHGWFFAKLDVQNVLVLDYFGGAKQVPVADYFEAPPY